MKAQAFVTAVCACLLAFPASAIDIVFKDGTVLKNATIYVPDSMIGSVVGQGGASVRELEEEYNLRFQVKGLKTIPRNLDRIPEEHGGNWDIQTQQSMGGRHWEQHGGSNKSRRRKGRKRR